ncbi:MAG: hypothetical protein JNK82_45455 [Myxococcaceae bacterium]|nr:hypothetical protein [Myxococcaceae bacterium]
MIKGTKSDLASKLASLRPASAPATPPRANGLRDTLREARQTVLNEANNYANSPAERRDAQERLLNIENDYDRKLGAPTSSDPGLQSLYEARTTVMRELNNLAGPAGRPGPERDDALKRLANILGSITRAETASAARESAFISPRPSPVKL